MPDLRSPQVLRLAVTGTDTGVGKTLVTCALAAGLRTAGRRVAAMKPIETGVAAAAADGLGGGAPHTDAERLHRAAGSTHTLADVCPVTYAEPLAPLVAADRAERPVDLARLDAARARLEADADVFLVEGAGGLLVPLARDVDGGIVDFASLALRWNLDLVVVAANRLGVLNHALLTVREAERRGIAVRAVVLNTVHAAPADVAEATNGGVLRTVLRGVPVLETPFVPAAARDDAGALARLGAPMAAMLLAR